jgi:hypothetical protein
MKLAFAVLVFALLSAIGGVAYANFSLVETAMTGEWMLLKDAQAKECKDGGGCAVFSEREFHNAVYQTAMQLLMQRGKSL